MSIKKFISSILILVVVISLAKTLILAILMDNSHIVERAEYRGNDISYIGYLYLTPVAYPKCDYGIDGSCSIHGDRSDCRSQFGQMSNVEVAASAFTLLVNLFLFIIAYSLSPEWRPWRKEE